jgi:hypothetical protein
MVPNVVQPQDFNRYSFVRNNPLKYRDSTGHWAETVFDVAMLGISAKEFWDEPNLENGAALVVDFASVILPIPAVGGILIKGGKRLEQVGDLIGLTNKVDEGVAAYRSYRGADIHSASTGKAFSDWFKSNILSDLKAKGKYIDGGERRLDIFKNFGDDAETLFGKGAKGDQIFELKNYTNDTAFGKAFWDQARAYSKHAERSGAELNYVFGQKLDRLDEWRRLRDEFGARVWYIDDAGRMVEWIP